MTSPPRPHTVDDVIDLAEITTLVHTYAKAIDSRDDDLLTSVFTEDATVDYTSAGGMAGTAAEFVDWLRDALAAFPILQHFVTNILVETEGDEGTGSVYVFARQGIEVEGKVEYLDAGGWYEDAYRRTSNGWRISRRVEHTTWFDGAFYDRVRDALPNPLP